MRVLIRIAAYEFSGAVIRPKSLATLNVENFQVALEAFRAIHCVTFKVYLKVGEE
jgi:hypothetical protein